MTDQKVSEIFSQVHNDMAIAEPVDADAERELTTAEKVDFIYAIALKADQMLTDIMPQISPILSSLEKNPMLKMFLKK